MFSPSRCRVYSARARGRYAHWCAPDTLREKPAPRDRGGLGSLSLLWLLVVKLLLALCGLRQKCGELRTQRLDLFGLRSRLPL
jgi:hypothetical protein